MPVNIKFSYTVMKKINNKTKKFNQEERNVILFFSNLVILNFD